MFRDRSGRSWRWASVLSAVLGCDAPEDTTASNPPPPDVLEAVLVGCMDTTPGEGCVFDPARPLTLWANVDKSAAPTLNVDGAVVDSRPVDVSPGMRWSLTPSTQWRVLEVQSKRGTRRLTLTPQPPPPKPLADVDALRRGHRITEARDALERAWPRLHEAHRTRGWELRGDLAFLQGDTPGAIAAYTEGAPLAAEHGERRRASRMAQRVIYACTVLLPDEQCVQTWLEHHARWSADDPENAVVHTYYRALFDAHLGDRRAAQRGFASILERANALGLHRVLAGSLIEAMLLAGEVGDWDAMKALQNQAETLAPQLRASERAQLHNAIGWNLLLAHARGRDDLPSASPPLQRALELSTDDDSVSQRLRAALKLNLAYMALLDDKLDDAERWLSQVGPDAPLRDEGRLWSRLLRARLDAQRGRLQRARTTYEALTREANLLNEPELAWHALTGGADVLASLGQLDDALARHTEAEALLEREVPKIAFGVGRSLYLEERSRGARRHVELLLEKGRFEHALCVARLARSRNLRVLAGSLQATETTRRAMRAYRQGRARLERELEAAWMLPQDEAAGRFAELREQQATLRETLDRAVFARPIMPSEQCERLPSPKVGELSLYFFELGPSWVAFAATRDGVTTRRLGAAPRAPEELGPWLLEPFHDLVVDAQTLRIVATGAAQAVRFASLTDPAASSRSLSARVGVAYGLDVPEPPSTTSGSDVLIVAPPSNLDYAASERVAVEAVYRGSEAAVRVLQRGEATAASVRSALPDVHVAHFVGHATADDDGWAGGFELANGDRFEVADALALERAPSIAILAGCETGKTRELRTLGGMSLAHAMVLAGSRVVIAADTRMSDRAAAALAQPLHTELRRGATGVAALAVARNAVREQGIDPPPLRAWIH